MWPVTCCWLPWPQVLDICYGTCKTWRPTWGLLGPFVCYLTGPIAKLVHTFQASISPVSGLLVHKQGCGNEGWLREAGAPDALSHTPCCPPCVPIPCFTLFPLYLNVSFLQFIIAFGFLLFSEVSYFIRLIFPDVLKPFPASSECAWVYIIMCTWVCTGVCECM